MMVQDVKCWGNAPVNRVKTLLDIDLVRATISSIAGPSTVKHWVATTPVEPASAGPGGSGARRWSTIGACPLSFR